MENNSALSTEQRDAFRLDAELKQHAGTVVSEMIEVGKCLKEINERRLYEYLGTGSFAEYAEKAVGLNYNPDYDCTKENVSTHWLNILIFIIVFPIASIIVLQFVDMDKETKNNVPKDAGKSDI